MISISVITICKNSASTIENTILSVISQLEPADEFIIVDGGSVDGTIQIVEKYSDRITKILSENDEGISDAFNKGISLATGKYIGILNSDDLYALNTLSNVRAMIASYGDEFVFYGDTCQVVQDEVTAVTPKYLSYCYSVPFSHCAMFVPRSIYRNYGVYSKEFRYAMDVELILRLVKSGVTFQHDASVYLYKGMCGITQKRRVAAFMDYFKASCKHNGFACSFCFLTVKLAWHFLLVLTKRMKHVF